MRTDSYIANFELAVSKYFKGGVAPSHVKRQLFWDALTSQQKSAMGCQKLEGTFEMLIKFFKRVFYMSHCDALGELHNIRMKEGESIMASQSVS